MFLLMCFAKQLLIVSKVRKTTAFVISFLSHNTQLYCFCSLYYSANGTIVRLKWRYFVCKGNVTMLGKSPKSPIYKETWKSEVLTKNT